MNSTFITITLVFLYLGTPGIIMYLVSKYAIFKKTGSIFIAYFLGLVIGNLGLIPASLHNFQETFSGIAVLLAIPLLLFTVKIKNIISTTGNVAKCFLGGLIAVIITVSTGYLLWHNQGTEMWKTSGMLVGVYTGGTPNLAGIQAALQVKPAHFVLLNTYDMLLSSMYLLFLFTIGSKLFIKFLGKSTTNNQFSDDYITTINEKSGNYWQPVALAVIIVLIALGLSFTIYGKVNMLLVILIITTVSLSATLIPKLNNNKRSYDVGMYFILIFSIAVASMADINSFKEVAPYLLRYLGWVVFGSLFLHLLWCKIFKLKGDLMIVVSVALICSPPFVPAIAGHVKNKDLVVAGLTVGLIGYAIGNYLGITMAWVLHALGK